MRVTILLFLAMLCATASAQQPTEHLPAPEPRNDISLGYRYVKANDTGGGISLGGGYLESGTRIRSYFGLVTEASQTRAASGFTLFSLATGPRITLSRHGVSLYGQLLLGVGHGSQANAASISTRIIQPSGGVNLRLNQRFSLRLIDIGVLQTAFANDGTGSQSHLLFSSGLVWKFNNFKRPPAPLRVREGMSEIFFTCGTQTPAVVQGESVEILGHATTEPDEIALSFAWASNGGKVIGVGRQVMLDTVGAQPGEYKVHGRASLVSSPTTSKDCDFTFHVLPAASHDIIADKR